MPHSYSGSKYHYATPDNLNLWSIYCRYKYFKYRDNMANLEYNYNCYGGDGDGNSNINVLKFYNLTILWTYLLIKSFTFQQWQLSWYAYF